MHQPDPTAPSLGTTLQHLLVAVLVLLCWVGLIAPGHSAVFGKNTHTWFQSRSYMSALNAIQQQNYGQAKQLLIHLHQQYPEQPRLLLDLAHVHQKLGETSRANDAITQLQQQFPTSMEAQWGKQLLTSGNPSAPSPTAAATIHHTVSAPTQTPSTEATSEATPVVTSAVTPTQTHANTQTATPPHTYYYPWETPESQTMVTRPTPATTQQGQPAPAAQPRTAVMAPAANNATPAPQQGMDAAALQNLMLMSMIMGNNGSNNGNADMSGMGSMMGGNTNAMGNMNPMMLMMMPGLMGQQQGSGANSTPAMSPEVMSNLMMQSMMGGLDFGGSNDDRR